MALVGVVVVVINSWPESMRSPSPDLLHRSIFSVTLSATPTSASTHSAKLRSTEFCTPSRL